MLKVTCHPPPIEDDPRAVVRERLDRELVRQMMEQPAKYDPARSIVAWARGFLKHILPERSRKRARRSREVAVTDLGVEATDLLFDGLQAAARKHASTGQLDPHPWLEKLSEADRQGIVCRFFKDLTGAALAVATGHFKADRLWSLQN